jgi:hypothetical protein
MTRKQRAAARSRPGPKPSARKPAPRKPPRLSPAHRIQAALAVLTCGLLVYFLAPDISLQFSSAKPVVEAIEQDVIWVDPAVTGVDTEAVRSAFGDRPLAMVVLPSSSPLAEDPGDTCAAVADRISGLIVSVVVDGEPGYGCENDDLPYAGGQDPFAWDFVQWVKYGHATTFLKNDFPAQARQLAVSYDRWVSLGKIDKEIREYRTPGSRILLAAALLVAVLGAAVVVWIGAGRAVRWWTDRRDRRKAWQDRADDLELTITKIALDLKDHPEPGPGRAVDPAFGQASRDYLLLLDDWETVRPGDDLDPLVARADELAERLDRIDR